MKINRLLGLGVIAAVLFSETAIANEELTKLSANPSNWAM